VIFSTIGAEVRPKASHGLQSALARNSVRRRVRHTMGTSREFQRESREAWYGEQTNFDVDLSALSGALALVRVPVAGTLRR